MRPSRDSRFIRLLFLIFFLFAAGYALYEARGLLYGPEIDIASAATSVRESFVMIQGRAERITELRLNGKTISVTEGGDFSEPHLLAPGSNRIILEARDARGRTARETMDIVYLAPEERPAATMPQAAASGVLATSSPSTTPSAGGR
jgi:hypothetical protein